MKIKLSRSALLKPLQQICGVVERRQTMPALANVLMQVQDGTLRLTTTDLEVELRASLSCEMTDPGEATIPARKLLDICRALPEDAQINITLEDGRARIISGRSRFTLLTLPASEFPVLEDIEAKHDFALPQRDLKNLVERTAFAMANQDVRYYLNGLLLEVSANKLRAVATDGHRLALCDHDMAQATDATHQVIIPRKGIHELLRILSEDDEQAEVQLSDNHIRVSLSSLRLTSKLIDGRYPDYNRVVPREGDKTLLVDREAFRQALIRASILSNEKYRGIRLVLNEATLKIQAHNPEQEEAEEEIEVEYGGEELEVGFNVTYLLDALSVIDSAQVETVLKDANSSALLKNPTSSKAVYVIMPMRL